MSENLGSPRVALITGPTSGLGRALALELAARGYTLVLLGRSESKLEELAAECVALGAPSPTRLVCDMAVQADVRRAAAELLATDLPLHVLVNNAGLINQRRRVTVDGIEETFAVGYASAFLLTMLLAERLSTSAPAQVIFTTSDTYPIGELDLNDPAFAHRYGPIRAYASSKLACVQLARMLAEKLGPFGVRVNVYNPGMNYTNLAVGNNHGVAARVGDFFWKRIASPVQDGIVAPLRLIDDPGERATNGALFMTGVKKPMTEKARDPLLGEALWEMSENLTGARLPASLVPGSRRHPGAPIRIGVLGAARIAPFALFKHVAAVPGVEIAAIAEEYQSFAKTLAYAREHRIPKVYRRFGKLLADPTIDAVYLALPISQHAEWALACIAAGKHLLCEKPLGANAEQAARIDAAQRGTGLVVAEAMHSLQHPMVARVREILASGEIGAITRVDASFSAYLPQKDFRFVYALGGGGMLDMGCYPVALLRAMLGTEPIVKRAKAVEVEPRIDGVMDAELAFPNAPDVRLFVAMRSLRRPLDVTMRFVGTRGSLHILNFMKPEVFHRITVRSPEGQRSERVPGGSTYEAQLRAFVSAVRGGLPMRTTTAEAVRTLTVVDAIYEAAGLPRRGLPS